MSQLLPLATSNDYKKFGNRFILEGAKYLALPGAVTDDPLAGAQRYNDSLLNHYMVDSESLRDRVNYLFKRYKKNHRIKNIKCTVRKGEPYQLQALSPVEKYLFFYYLSC